MVGAIGKKISRGRGVGRGVRWVTGGSFGNRNEQDSREGEG